MKSAIPLADVMKVSDEECLLMTGAATYEEAADQLLAMGPKLVAVTLGGDGVLVATKEGKENGTYLLLSKFEEDVVFEYHITIQDENFNLGILTMRTPEGVFEVDFDAE